MTTSDRRDRGKSRHPFSVGHRLDPQVLLVSSYVRMFRQRKDRRLLSSNYSHVEEGPLESQTTFTVSNIDPRVPGTDKEYPLGRGPVTVYVLPSCYV